MRKFLAVLALFSLTLTPVMTLAASPAEIIRNKIRDSVVRSLENQIGFPFGQKERAEKMTMTLRIDALEKFLKKGKPAESGYAEMFLSVENYPVSDTQTDVALTFDLPVIWGSFNGVEINYEHPITLELRAFNNKVLYVRVTDVSDEIKAATKEFGLDIEPFINQWIKIDAAKELQKLDPDNEALQSEFKQEELAARFKAWFLATEKKLGSPITIVRLQKPALLSNGDKGQVVTVKFNSRWYNAIAAFALEDYKKSHPGATKRELDTEKKAIAKVMKEVRTEIDRLQTLVTVNLIAQSISGFSVKYSKTERTYEYDYQFIKNKFVSTKKTKGSQTMTVNASVNFSPIEAKKLEVPVQSMTAEEVWSLIYPKKNPIEFLEIDTTAPTSSSY